MEKSIKFSVVIPTYNRESTIYRCISSVLNQTFQDFEIIVVDDCSTDLTKELVLSIPDSRIKFIESAEKSGAQRARNIGIKESKYSWIAFLDSDDYWEPIKLEKMAEIIKKNSFNLYMVIHSDCYCLDEISGKKWIWRLPLTQGYSYKLLLKRPSPMFQGMVTSKRVIEEIGMLDEKVPSYQEWETSIRLSQKCIFFHIREPLFTYVFHEEETISKNKLKEIDGYSYILNKFRNEMLSNKLVNKHIINLIIKCLSYNLTNKINDFVCQLDVPAVIRNFLTFFLFNKFFSRKIKLIFLNLLGVIL
ncbi:MAG: glycosyltransferase family 2 protein [Brevinematales bacterium]